MELPATAGDGQNRDLIYFLAKKDIVVRYKQTAVGALWAVLQPVLLAGVFSIFLARAGTCRRPTPPTACSR